MTHHKSLTIIICADVQLTWLAEVPYEVLQEVAIPIETQVQKLLQELFAGARVVMQPPIVDDRSIHDVLQDDDAFFP